MSTDQDGEQKLDDAEHKHDSEIKPNAERMDVDVAFPQNDEGEMQYDVIRESDEVKQHEVEVASTRTEVEEDIEAAIRSTETATEAEDDQEDEVNDDDDTVDEDKGSSETRATSGENDKSDSTYYNEKF